MALPNLEWNKDWLQGSWATTRAIWAPLTPDDETADECQWSAAVSESGFVARIVLSELCQLVTDIYAWMTPHQALPAGPPRNPDEDKE